MAAVKLPGGMTFTAVATLGVGVALYFVASAMIPTLATLVRGPATATSR